MKNIMRASVFFLLFTRLYAHEITIVGCGYVGLTLTAVLSQCGHEITCIDIDQEKIASLKNKQLYLYEPQLKELLFHVPTSDNITFSDNIRNVQTDTDIFYICVPTPTDVDGQCNCSFLYAAFDDIVRYCTNTQGRKIICVKSTVPPGTIRKLQNRLSQQQKSFIVLVYNPEFMREGSAIEDIYMNNPLVLGGESADALEKIEDLYRSFLHEKSAIIKTNFETAEMIKYAWNSFSAIRIAYVNELAVICRQLNADIRSVVEGLALSEQMLPTAVLKPGPGYGGSCLPKDTVSFSRLLEEQGFESSMIHQAIKSNQCHIERVAQDICGTLESSRGQKIVTILGLSFKANTNDIRNAPSMHIVPILLKKGIKIQAYDPQAASIMKTLFPDVEYCDSPYEAIQNTDCIVLLTDWPECKNIDFDIVASLCNKKVIIDTRNIYDPTLLQAYGFTYINMGVQK